MGPGVEGGWVEEQEPWVEDHGDDGGYDDGDEAHDDGEQEMGPGPQNSKGIGEGSEYTPGNDWPAHGKKRILVWSQMALLAVAVV